MRFAKLGKIYAAFFFFFPFLVFVLYFGRIIREWGRSVGAGKGVANVMSVSVGEGGGTRVLPRYGAQRTQVLYSGAFRYRAVRFHNAFASTFSLVF